MIHTCTSARGLNRSNFKAKCFTRNSYVIGIEITVTILLKDAGCPVKRTNESRLVLRPNSKVLGQNKAPPCRSRRTAALRSVRGSLSRAGSATREPLINSYWSAGSRRVAGAVAMSSIFLLRVWTRTQARTHTRTYVRTRRAACLKELLEGEFLHIGFHRLRFSLIPRMPFG